MRDYILALDQGTTSSRAIVFDPSGNARAMAQKEHPQIYPRPGWVEHDPEAIWSTQLETARGALQQAGISTSDLAAIGIANQKETTFLWDRKTGAPLANAIVWQDRRTASECERLRAELGEAEIAERTGLLPDPYFSGTKLAWLLDHIPGARERAERGELAFGTVDTFLLWRLTGGKVHATDPTNASRTLLFNLRELAWDGVMLDALRIPRALLPEVVGTSERIAESAPDPLGSPVTIASLVGDQQAASFGQACFHPGQAKNTYGTGAFLLLNTGAERPRSRNRLLGTVAWARDRTAAGGFREASYALEGSIFVAGAAIQWLRDELKIVESADEAEALARSVPDTLGVTMVPAFVGLGAPHWDPAARGAILGLTRGAGRAHLCRAALEAACFRTREVLDAMRLDTGIAVESLRVDGGMARNDLMLQMQADLLGIPVVRPTITETTALGVAWLAGLAAGVWKDFESLERSWRVDRTFEPAIGEDERESRFAEWKRAVARVASSGA